MKCSTPEISYHSRAGGVNQPILSVDVLGTRMLASGGADDEVKLWDILGEPKFLAGLTGHLKTVNVVRFSPDGRFLASASDGTCAASLARSGGRGVKCKPPPLATRFRGAVVAFLDRRSRTSKRHLPTPSVQGTYTRLCSASRPASHTPRFAHAPLRSRPASHTPRFAHAPLRSRPAPGPAHPLTSCPLRSRPAPAHAPHRTRSASPNRPAHPLLSPHSRDPPHPPHPSPDGILILWNLKSATMEWHEVKSDSCLAQRVLRGCDADIYDLAWSPRSDALATGSIDSSVIIWSASTGRVLHRIQDHSHYVQGCAWDPLNVLLVSQSSDRSVRLYAHAGAKSAKGAKPKLLKTMVKRLLPKVIGEDGESKQSSHGLFMDDSVPSFFRRPDFSPDGNILCVPSGACAWARGDGGWGDGGERRCSIWRVQGGFRRIFTALGLDTWLRYVCVCVCVCVCTARGGRYRVVCCRTRALYLAYAISRMLSRGL